MFLSSIYKKEKPPHLRKMKGGPHWFSLKTKLVDYEKFTGFCYLF